MVCLYQMGLDLEILSVPHYLLSKGQLPKGLLWLAYQERLIVLSSLWGGLVVRLVLGRRTMALLFLVYLALTKVVLVLRFLWRRGKKVELMAGSLYVLSLLGLVQKGSGSMGIESRKGNAGQRGIWRGLRRCTFLSFLC
jgi:hypothetical protein